MLGNLFGQNEERAISFQSIWGAGAEWQTTTEAGTVITQDNAMQISTFWACILLISDTISTLPMDSYKRIDGERVPYRPKPTWVDKPDISMLRSEHYQQALVSYFIDGNIFVRIYRDGSGNVANLVVLDPTTVEVKRNKATGKKYFVINENYTSPIAQDQMIHITEITKPGQLRGVSRVEELKDNLGLTSALQTFASKFFAQGAITSGVIETPLGLNREQAKELVDGYSTRHKGLQKSHKIGVLTGGAKFNKTSVNPDEAQMLESRKLQIEEICRIFRVPPHMVGVTTAGSMSYASVEQNSINFVTHTLRPTIAKIEDAYSALLPDGAFLRVNVDGLLRGDFATRMQGYSIGSQAGFYSTNDIRRFEDLRPVTGGDVYRVPLANVDLAAASLVETDKKVTMAQKLILSGFDPASVLVSLGLPPIQHSGVPSVQLQGVAQIDPEDPTAVYDTKG
jgi:HK97 family phage portal protein